MGALDAERLYDGIPGRCWLDDAHTDIPWTEPGTGLQIPQDPVQPSASPWTQPGQWGLLEGSLSLHLLLPPLPPPPPPPSLSLSLPLSLTSPLPPLLYLFLSPHPSLSMKQRGTDMT